MKKIVIVLALLALIIAGVFLLNRSLNVRQPLVTDKNPVIIGFSLGTTREERWSTDRDLFIQKAKELGAVVNIASSDYDAVLQASQIENLASQGAKVIVVLPSDSEALAPVIEKVKAEGVKIIAYDRLIKNSNIDLYISFDSVKVGQLEASSVLAVVGSGSFAYIGGAPTDNNAFLVKEGTMKVLDPKIQNGEIQLVVNEFMEGWKPDEAYRTIKEYLATGGRLDAVIAANDGTAFGTIQALKEKGLDGKIPVSGQDAELSACQRIIAGTQTSTVYKPINLLAYKTAEIAVAMANGQAPESNNVMNNGLIDVPSYLIEPTLVTKENMQATIIKDGYHTYEEVYETGTK